MKYPPFLRKNDTIGFVAPSFGCATEPYRTSFLSAIEKWKNLGYGIDLGPNCFFGDGIGISNTPKECGKELTEYHTSKKNQILISCGGGELMCETMSFVDFEAIKKSEPKWYMGYSDNTNMIFLLTTLCDTAAIYGPCATTFGMEPWHISLNETMEILEGNRRVVCNYEKWEKEKLRDEEHPLEPYYCTEDVKIRAYTPLAGSCMENLEIQETELVSMKGRLIGGCMDCLVNLLGTRFDGVKAFTEKYKEDGFLWFLEACDLNVFGIRRAMWQMEEAGWFQYIKGFIIGRPLCNGQEMMGLDQYEAILPIARKHGVPVIMDADIGHLPPMMPLVSGSIANVTAKNGKLEIRMEFK